MCGIVDDGGGGGQRIEEGQSLQPASHAGLGELLLQVSEGRRGAVGDETGEEGEDGNLDFFL